MEKALKQQHFYWLDLLRFLAAFMVLFSHTRNDYFVAYNFLPADQQGPFAFLFYALGRLGHEAVMVFFVLSGFLVGGRGLEKISNGTFPKRSYVIDRFVRIMLPLIASVLLYFAVCMAMGLPFPYLRALGNLMSLQGIFCDSLVAPFWSLSYEVWFYIALLAISLIFSKSNWGGVALSALCILVFSCCLKPHYFFIWLIGAVCYLTKPQKINVWLFIASVVGIIAFIGLWQISSESNAMSFHFKIENKEFIEVMLGLSFGIFIQQIILCEPKHKFAVWLDTLGTKLAAFSYTLYLAHCVILLPIYKYLFAENSGVMNLKSFMIWLSILAMTMISCWLLYLAFEKHTATVKMWLKGKLSIQ